MQSNKRGKLVDQPEHFADERTEVSNLLGEYFAKGAFFKALRLTAESLPTRLNEVFQRAGNYFQERSLSSEVWQLLSELDPAHRADAKVLLAYLEAANATDNVPQVSGEVAAFLEREKAPNLRALYALLCLPPEAQLTEIYAAYTETSTAFTAFALGRVIAPSESRHAEELFRTSLELAEAAGDTFAALRAAWALSTQLTLLGKYEEARHWADWGLEVYAERDVTNRRLFRLLTAISAYARILTGDVAGLLVKLEAATTGVEDSIDRILLCNQGNLLLALGEPAEALKRYQRALVIEERSKIYEAGPHPWRCLELLGRKEEALAHARRIYSITKGTRSQGVAALNLARLEPELYQSLNLAVEACNLLGDAAPLFAQASAWAARLYHKVGNPEAAQAVIAASYQARRELKGIGLTFLECEDLITNETVPTLKLELLGNDSAWVNGKARRLSRRQLELLTILTLYPSGVTTQELRLHLHGDESSKSLKGLLSRIRKEIPLKARPYQLTLKVDADFIRVRALLREGQLSKAAALYNGPLLLDSTAPAIEEERAVLEEQLVRATAISDDAELIQAVASKVPKRPELLEALIKALPSSDPHRAVVEGELAALLEKYNLND